jgi:uncharacterized protein DUF5681
MSSQRWFERYDRRNTTVELVDSTGKFKIVEHYNERGLKRTFIQPLDTRFKKGQSGNPKGRPKRGLEPATLLKEMFNSTVAVREGDKRQFMTRAAAMIRGTVANGLRGDARSLTTIIDLLEMTGYLDHPIGEDRKWAPLILEEYPEDMDEWYLLGPDHKNERQKYLRMAEEEEARERGQNQSAGDKGGKSA